MLAFLSVWTALASLVIAVAMLIYRPAMTDLTVVLVLYFGVPGSLCFAGLVLWALRKESRSTPGVSAQRLQAQAAGLMAIVAAVIVYMLIIFAERIPKIEA